MDSKSVAQLAILKSELLRLTPTGELGFEGLVQVVLGDIAGIPFRLSSSGSQFGVDGDSAYSGDHVSFECKRYDDEIPKEKAKSKLADLSLRPDVDLWALCATTEIHAQFAKDLRAIAELQGLEVLILDWSESELSSLAVAIAMPPERVISDFLAKAGVANSPARKVLDSLSAVRSDAQFHAHAGRIGTGLNIALLSQESTRRANEGWLAATFVDREQAKVRLGQPLAPNDPKYLRTLERPAQTGPLQQFMKAATNESTLFVLGEEGVGKSWVVAQAWSEMPDRPVMLLVPADRIVSRGESRDLTSLLYDVLPEQVTPTFPPQYKERWKRKIERWLGAPPPFASRLVVVIDGINQRPDWDWAREIAALASELLRVGGRLVVTSRAHYFRAYVQPRHGESFTRVMVPEWSTAQRDEILRARGMNPVDVSVPVASALRNPRLLSTALRLLDNEDIARLRELSVSHLLFEHLRTIERDSEVPQPAIEFAKRLRDHASLMIERVSKAQREDLRVFDGASAAADGRFFRPLDDDATRYELKDEGLTFALGLALLDHLRKAGRNSKDVIASVNELIDPISALDHTGRVLMAAISIGCVDDSYGNDVRSALAVAFADLQNPDASDFEPFAALTARRPGAFMLAARHLWLAGGHQPNVSWINTALFRSANDPKIWTVMSTHLEGWLKLHSLSPARGLLAGDDSDRSGKLQKKEEALRERLERLSPREQEILAELTESPGDLSRLSFFAFNLLAGKPLAPLAPALISWCFSNSLNSDFSSPHDEFLWLGRTNFVDWAETRTAILSAERGLAQGETSSVGKWALLVLLRFTGDARDGATANALEEKLTEGQERFPGWRLKEKWCASDPCDPCTIEPDGFAHTIARYADIDPSNTHAAFGTSSEDHFFEAVQPALARFRPGVAISKFHDLARNVLERKGMGLRQGLIALADGGPLLTHEHAKALIRLRTERLDALTSELSEKDRQFLSYECLVLAFPTLSGDEQLDALTQPAMDQYFAVHLIPMFRDASQQVLEERISKAIDDRDERTLRYLIEFLHGGESDYSEKLLELIRRLLTSNMDDVRALTYWLLRDERAERPLQAFCRGDWAARDEVNNVAAKYGSEALIRGAELGLIDPFEVVTRVSLSQLGLLAGIGPHGALACASLVDDAITRTAAATVDAPSIVIESQIETGACNQGALLSLTAISTPTSDPFAALDAFNKNPAGFERDQEDLAEAYDRFRAELSAENASVVLDSFSQEQFAAILEARPGLAPKWTSLFLSMPRARRGLVYNFALHLACVLSRDTPFRAVELLEAYDGCEPFVHLVRGHSRIPLHCAVVWSAAASETFDGLRRARLDAASSDHELSLEVLMAQLAGQSDLLDDYVCRGLSSNHPAQIARALMVVGFLDASPGRQLLLERAVDKAGLPGCAQIAAKYAYERNVWARHWLEGLCNATDGAEYWRNLILFSEVADGRVDLYLNKAGSRAGPVMLLFAGDCFNQIRHRLEKWRNKRKKTLFGLERPSTLLAN